MASLVVQELAYFGEESTREFKYAIETWTTGGHEALFRTQVASYERVSEFLTPVLGTFGVDYMIAITAFTAHISGFTIYTNDNDDWRIMDRLLDVTCPVAANVKSIITNPMMCDA